MANRFPSRPRAVITGAASGFGRALALALASRDARLVLSDVDEAGLAETVELAERQGGEARSIVVDVRDAEQVEAQVALCDEAYGGVDFGANNAGVAVAGPVGEVPLEDWKWQIDINLYGVIYGCHALVPRMKRQGSGWILNVASAAGIISAPQMAPYNVTKAGVISLSETMAGELAETGVSVSVLCPTFFRTSIHESARATGRLKKATQKLVTESKWSAEQVAEVTLKSMERGELYVIPMLDAKAYWRAKRLLGGRFYSMVGRVMRSRRVAEILGDR